MTHDNMMRFDYELRIMIMNYNYDFISLIETK